MNIYDELKPEKTDSFAFDYKNKKEAFNWQTIRYEINVPKLESTYTIFQELSDRITILSKDFFKQIIDKDKTHDNKIYYDLSCVYIAEIQNLYLNPINYQINKLESEESLSKANDSIMIGNKSICWSKISVGIAIIIGIISLLFSTLSFFNITYNKFFHCSTEKPKMESTQIITEKDSSKIEFKEFHCYVDSTKNTN